MSAEDDRSNEIDTLRTRIDCLPMRCLALIILLCLLSQANTFAVEDWKCWEHSLSSSHAYDNPLLDVTLSIQYTSPSGKTYDCYGFWDGDRTYRIRFMFNEIGKWSWKTTCSDTSNRGLHAVSGSVEVTPFQGTNPLYKHGYLKVSDDKRYLVHDNGTPFLWIGDTAWTANRFATDAEWRTYVNNRRDKRISVILVSCGWIRLSQTNAEGQRYFMADVPLSVNCLNRNVYTIQNLQHLSIRETT